MAAMDMSSMFMRASSTVVHRPLRTILSGSITNYAFSRWQVKKRESTFISCSFSTDAKKLIDSKLVQILESEIKSKKINMSCPRAPPHFPFRIEDTPGDLYFVLRGETINGEEIQIKVFARYSSEELEAYSNNDYKEEDVFVLLEVAMCKGYNADDSTLKFFSFKVGAGTHNCEITRLDNDIKIDGLIVDGYEDFHHGHTDDFRTYCSFPLERGTDLHSAMRRYIEIRGINLLNAAFIWKYKMWRVIRDRELPLEKLINFVVDDHNNSNPSPVSSDELKRVDQELIQVIDSLSPLDPSDIPVPEMPTDFPFEIKDTSGEERRIELTRELDGENIVVDVFYGKKPRHGRGGDNLSADIEESARRRFISFDQPCVKLTVNITKENGSTMQLIFYANANYIGNPEEVKAQDTIPLFSNKEDKHHDEEDNKWRHELQEDYWREFIRVRGIDDSIGGILIDYMERRCRRHYLVNLREFRKFVNQ